MTCPTPSEVLPEKFQGARLVSGVGFLERPDGVSGCFMLASGWYYTDAGRARIASAVDLWQVRIDDMQVRLASMQASMETARPLPVRCPEPVEHDPGSFATAAVCLGLGFLLGRALPRRPHGAKDAR